ncbi:MAG: hypothetical protein IPL01_22445 [Acidobacteria bacterium]|nr:hypothetical protein [Acidobacteriota bacterium]
MSRSLEMSAASTPWRRSAPLSVSRSSRLRARCRSLYLKGAGIQARSGVA